MIFERLLNTIIYSKAVIWAVIGMCYSAYRALIFLVISCPCALVISVPMAFFGGIGSAASKGILY
ncbi:MAG: heavy metal translocating P-type ATPase, partial [Alistipes sp.]|nr:heavy metal translocating P-type ATPase [Alistipes sp.]